jgi:hypothetical protein
VSLYTLTSAPFQSSFSLHTFVDALTDSEQLHLNEF